MIVLFLILIGKLKKKNQDFSHSNSIYLLTLTNSSDASLPDVVLDKEKSSKNNNTPKKHRHRCVGNPY